VRATWIAGACGLAALVSVLAAAPGTTALTPAEETARELPAGAMWDDGRAEYSTYDVVGRREGHRRTYRAVAIVVKEEMNTAERVKAEVEKPVRGRTTTVLKLNTFYTIPVGTYAFHEMSTVFLDRATWRPLKLATSSQDGCGLTFVEALPRDGRLTRTSHSYWEGQGDRTETANFTSDALFLEALPLWLRAHRRLHAILEGGPARALTIERPVLLGQTGNKVRPLRVVTAVIRIQPDSSAAIRADVDAGGDRESYWFDPEAPHVPVRMVRRDGSVWTLRKTQRLAYWQHAAPGDERLVR
jgi:hypothetical protein